MSYEDFVKAIWPATAPTLRELADAQEIWLMEHLGNSYEPKPPPGWFGMRSHRRRGFFKLNDGRIPAPEEIERRIEAGDFRELPL